MPYNVRLSQSILTWDTVERVALLIHILRNLRDRGITHDQLQAATNDVITQLQSESRPMLAELYKVAKYEERYVRGEIG